MNIHPDPCSSWTIEPDIVFGSSLGPNVSIVPVGRVIQNGKDPVASWVLGPMWEFRSWTSFWPLVVS